MFSRHTRANDDTQVSYAQNFPAFVRFAHKFNLSEFFILIQRKTERRKINSILVLLSCVWPSSTEWESRIDLLSSSLFPRLVFCRFDFIATSEIHTKNGQKKKNTDDDNCHSIST